MYGWFQRLLKSKILPTSQEEEKAKTSVSTTPSSSKPTKQPSALSSHLRWRRKYDLLVCHSDTDRDIEEAKYLVSFLEASPRSLRCFLWQRDVCPGSPVFTEFCEAVQESHMQALLITPDFLQDGWCMYMMHQALADGPVSKRLIPLIQNLSHKQYPKEIRFFFYINLRRDIDQGYSLINKTVLTYLEALERSSQGHELISSNDPAESDAEKN